MKAIMAAHGHLGYGHLTRSLKALWRQLLLLLALQVAQALAMLALPHSNGMAKSSCPLKRYGK
jgi:hypothetical protein